jgi:EAL domain-containing protein (putative c-di-GMP-specific phosphodiesterase class I)
VRWHHPVLGTISPVDFIPIAEKTGLIVTVGEWILREACRQLKAWQDELRHATDLWVSVNLSAVQLKDPALLQRVSAALGDAGLQPRGLVLELTESTAMENPTAIKSLLMQLRSSGVRISIDDFGTGYSSLAHLRQFPVDALKIDRSFVRGIETRQDTAAIVGTLIDMAQQLGLHVVAEGIENEHQFTLLRSLRCHAAQGFLFARPLEEAKALEFLRHGQARQTSPKAAARPARVFASAATWPWAACAAVAVLTAGFLLSPLGAVEPTALPVVSPPPSPVLRSAAASPVTSRQSAMDSTAASATKPGAAAVLMPRAAADPAGRGATPERGSALSTLSVPPALLDAAKTATPPPPTSPQAQSPLLAADSVAVRVTHSHRIGHCEGQLIASRTGISYAPDGDNSKDAFDFKYSDFVHLLQDDTLIIKSSTRTFRFKAEDNGRGPTLSDFESRIARAR